MSSEGLPRDPVPARTQADRRAATEARLLDAAYRIVAERGVRAVTTAAVGQRAGYSRGIVNHHFGSRDKLMMRLAEEAQGRFAPDPGDLPGRDRVLSVASSYLEVMRADGAVMRVFLRLWSAAVGDEEPSLTAAFRERDRHFRDYFAAAITDGRADGSVESNVDPAATATALVGLLRGIAMQYQVDPGIADDERIRAAAVALIDGGISSRTAG
jgi:AcrR family transcriptional regulator